MNLEVGQKVQVARWNKERNIKWREKCVNIGGKVKYFSKRELFFHSLPRQVSRSLAWVHCSFQNRLDRFPGQSRPRI